MSLQRMPNFQKRQQLIQNLYRSIRWSLLVCFCAGWITACGTHTTQPAVPSAQSSCRIVQHAMGEACVPANPQRVVALSGFAVDAVLALGMKPIGAVTNVADLWADQMQNVEPLGLDDQVSLEKILALQPDLILGSQWNAEPIYEQLSTIAPTVLDDAILGEWKSSFALHADALGKTEAANQLMAQYQQQVQDFQAQAGESLKQTEISLVRVLPEGIGLYLKNSFAGTILDEIGFARPPAQNKGVVGEEPFVVVIGKERIEDADGDMIFVWTFGATSDIAQSAQNALQQLQTDPLWLQLDAVQNGNVHVVNDYWHVASTPTQAMLVIDDLLKYWVNE